MNALAPFRIRILLFGGLALLFLISVAGVGYSVYGLRVTQRDYALRDRVRDLQSAVAELHRQARHYKTHAPRDFPDYARDTQMYYAQLRAQLAGITSTMASLGACEAAIAFAPQLEELRDYWRGYAAGLDERLGQNNAEPRLEWGAEFMLQRERALSGQVSALAGVLDAGIEARLQSVSGAAQWGGPALLLFSGVGLAFFYRGASRRFGQTIAGCNEIAAGRFGHQIPVRVHDELSSLDDAVNALSRRLKLVVGLLDDIQRGADLRTTMEFVREALTDVLSMDWFALFELAESREHAVLLEALPADPLRVENAPMVTIADSWIARAVGRGEPARRAVVADEPDPLRRGLNLEHLQSFVVLPLLLDRGPGLLLVIGSVRRDAYNDELLRVLGNLSAVVAHGFEKSVLTERLLLAAIQGLSKLAESRDPETGDHLLRMSLYSAALASGLVRHGLVAGERIPPGFVRDILRYAPMHDIGKVGIADAILLKPGRLTDEERADISQHPLIGGEVLRTCASQLPEAARGLFDVAIEIAEGHHEKYDGSGYPRGLKGADIPLSARIIAVADVFDALTSKRPYKDAWPVEKAMQHIKAQAGTHFDPRVAQALALSLPEICAIYDRHKHV